MSNFLSYYKQDKNKELKSMIKFTKILVAFDGSENGLKALEVAEHLTRDNHAELTVLYVHDSPLEYPLSMSATVAGDSYLNITVAGDSYLYMDPGPLVDNAHVEPVSDEFIIVEEEVPNEVMTLAKTKLRDLDNVIYEKRTGKAADEIVNYSNDNSMDLIVIGNRGIGAFKKLVTGSVSDKVSDQSECSVFIVK